MLYGVLIGIGLMVIGLCFRFRFYADDESRANVANGLGVFIGTFAVLAIIAIGIRVVTWLLGGAA